MKLSFGVHEGLSNRRERVQRLYTHSALTRNKEWGWMV